MNTTELFVNFMLNLISGIVGILIVLWIERQKRPGLTIKLGQSGELKDDDPLKRMPGKWLHVQVHNKNVPKWLSWVYHGEPALASRAWITFHHLDGQKVFDREMIARWSSSEEPKVVVISIDNEQAKRLIGGHDYIDIPPGEHFDLDIVFRSKNDNDCYGWSNESYLYDWKHPEWRLEKGRYIAKIKVKTGGREYINAFLIANDVRYEDLRLAEIDDDLKKKLK